MTNRFASIISYVLHPLMMSTYLFLCLILFAPYLLVPIGQSSTSSVVFIGLIWITTCVIPVVSLFILKMSGTITSINLDNRKERITPMVYTAIMYGVITYLFSTKMDFGHLITVFLGISTSLIIITIVITIFWKISLHALGVGGLIGFIMGFNQQFTFYHFQFVLPALFIVAAIVLSARLKLNVHTPKQVYVGFVLGICISFVSYVFYLN